MPHSTAPTLRQKVVLDLVTRYQLERNRPPSLREIAREIGVNSPNGVTCHIKALVKKRLLQPASRPGPGRWYVATPAIVATIDEGTVRVAATGAVTFTRVEWRRWLRARLRELNAAHPSPTAV